MAIELSSRERKHFAGLESLRGLAALCVVLYHVTWLNPTSDLGLVRNGPVMVDFFFVLSGFVIAHAYGHKIRGVRDLAAFMFLRLGRLYPLHIAMLLVFLGFELLKLHGEAAASYSAATPAFSVNTPEAFIANLFLVQAVGTKFCYTFNIPAWSISAELYTYLLFAMLSVPRAAADRRGVVSAGIAAAAFIVLETRPFGDAVCDYTLVRCLFGFFTGVTTYRIYAGIDAARRADLGGAAGWLQAFLVAALVVALSLGPTSGYDAVFTFAFAPLIFATAIARGGPIQSFLHSRALLWLGRVSFSLYLVHSALNRIIAKILMGPFGFESRLPLNGEDLQILTDWRTGAVALTIYLVLVMASSAVTYRFVEVTGRQLSKRLVTRWRGRREPAEHAPPHTKPASPRFAKEGRIP